jgi:hypothetical protein
VFPLAGVVPFFLLILSLLRAADYQVEPAVEGSTKIFVDNLRNCSYLVPYQE